MYPLDEFPTHGLGIYDDYETSEDFSGYLWATWTTMAAQPMQIDPALQAMIDQSTQMKSGQTGPSYDLGVSVDVDLPSQPTGSNEFACGVAAPFPDSTEDVSMESVVDKRSRESPDSTLKPEGKSLKTSESATAATAADTCTATSEVSAVGSTKPSNVNRKPKTIPEAKYLMWEVHQRMPAWKADKLIESNKTDQVDLAALGEATGILFDSREMLSEAVQCLERIRNEKDGKEDDKSGAHKSSDPHSSQDDEQEMSEDTGSDDPEGEEESQATPEGDASKKQDASGDTSGASKQDHESSSKEPENTDQQQDASASSSDPVTKKKTESVSESHEDWFVRVTKEGQEVLWHPKASDKCPTLLTGIRSSDPKNIDTLGWENKLETASLEKHAEYLRGRQFVVTPHPLEATAWENGFVPETQGLPSDDLESRILSLLPQLSHMVSAPRQPIAASNALLTRFDANIRPSWLRDWQSGFGGYTKVYEYQVGGQTKRMYSVAHVVRPRTATTEACLCFSLMSTLPSHKPWKRPAGQKDPSRSILLDLRQTQKSYRRSTSAMFAGVKVEQSEVDIQDSA